MIHRVRVVVIANGYFCRGNHTEGRRNVSFIRIVMQRASRLVIPQGGCYKLPSDSSYEYGQRGVPLCPTPLRSKGKPMGDAIQHPRSQPRSDAWMRPLPRAHHTVNLGADNLLPREGNQAWSQFSHFISRRCCHTCDHMWLHAARCVSGASPRLLGGLRSSDGSGSGATQRRVTEWI